MMSTERRMAPVAEQLEVLMSGVDYGDALLRQEMRAELTQRLAEDRPLRVYLGIDPTATSLTLGHTVPLRKLRQFQQFGHKAIFLIGDYTALVGDPSDKNKLRPMLSSEDIARNEATYYAQAARILDSGQTEMRHNSEWLGDLDLPAIISLMSKFTVAEMLRRDNFRKRFQEGGAVYLHEFLYALMQGYDAYALACDVQVGGTEQLFNLMAGRKIQEGRGQRPHVPVTLPILVGLDGKERMSKSLGNFIGVDEDPEEQYGKAMSIPDSAVMDYFVLATNVPRSELPLCEALLETDPLAAKKQLARTIVEEFHGTEAALAAAERFASTVQRKEVPPDIPEYPADGRPLIDVILAAGLAPSKRAARRLFQQGAVSVDGTKAELGAIAEPGTVIQVGKRRWLRLTE